MRSVSSILVVIELLVAFAPLEAIYRPGYGGGSHYGGGNHHGGGDDCETTTTTTPEPTSTTASVPKCPAGFTMFSRVPSANNLNTAQWCMKAVFQKDRILIQNANDLCTDGSTLTTFGSGEERTFFGNQLKDALASFGYQNGAMALDGRRIPACVTQNSTILGSATCSATKAFELQQKNTSPDFIWTRWAAAEPSATTWGAEVESCVQFAYMPSNANRNLLLNDFFCDRDVSPHSPGDTLYWNFGALCGVAPK